MPKPAIKLASRPVGRPIGSKSTLKTYSTAKARATRHAHLDDMIAKLAGSGLSTEDIKLFNFTPMTAAECSSKLKLPYSGAGFALPYFDLDGGMIPFYRYRYLEDTRRGFDKLTAKPRRYAQPKDSPVHAYLPPSVKWRAIADATATPLIVTEGELKAACACKYGLPTIGLGGVFSFQSARDGDALLPIFDEFDLSTRVIYICYDSDAATNENVLTAEKRLAERLLDRGAFVRICRLPPDASGGKVGLDDYLVAHGLDEFDASIKTHAYEYDASSELHALNLECMYVRTPGLIYRRSSRQRMTSSAFVEHAFSNRHYYENKLSSTGQPQLVQRPLAPAWLKWPARAEVESLICAPGAESIVDGRLNTWKGWGLKSAQTGDTTPWEALMRHIFGPEDRDSRRWFEAWCAYPLQHPGAKLATACLIWGTTHGSGKTLIGHTLMRIYGEHAREIHDTDLDNDRNEWAEDAQFVLADDIEAKGDRALMRRLMTMVTQKWMRIDPKYIPSYAQLDRMNYYYTSNKPDALFLDDDDRRYFVHEVHSGKFAAYREFVRWRDSEAGASALWAYLLGLQIEWFDPQAPAPETRSKQEMNEIGKSDLGGWVRDLRDNGVPMLKRAGFVGDFATSTELLMLYDPSGFKKATANAMARELKKSGFKCPGPNGSGSKMVSKDGSQRVAYIVRNYDKWKSASFSECCRHFAESRPEPMLQRRKY